MGAVCCTSDSKEDQREIQDSHTALRLPDAEETVGKALPSDANKEEEETQEAENADETWLITLSKAGGKKLGVDVDLYDGKSLMVETIHPGMMDDWNKENPDRQVRPEDLIVEVNASRGDAVQLTEVCKNDEVLRMVIWRPPASEKRAWREALLSPSDGNNAAEAAVGSPVKQAGTTPALATSPFAQASAEAEKAEAENKTKEQVEATAQGVREKKAIASVEALFDGEKKAKASTEALPDGEKKAKASTEALPDGEKKAKASAGSATEGEKKTKASTKSSAKKKAASKAAAA